MRALLVCIVACSVANPAIAQPRLPVAVDQRVRLWTDAADAVTGRVTALTPATVHVAVDGRDPVTVATATVRRVEISRGRTARSAGFRTGAIRGAIIMGALGAVLLALQHEQVGEGGSSAAKAAALGAWSGGLFGGLIGGGIGAARAGERWEEVWP